MFNRLIVVILLFTFTTSLIIPPSRSWAVQVEAMPWQLPKPGTMVNLSPAYEPLLIKGLTVHKDNPFLFDFIVDTGNDDTDLKNDVTDIQLRKEAERLIKYFFACLTIPEKDLWVNLSPYEKNRMVPQALGQTALGRDLLAQDYILKQLSASLIYPEKALGKEFWARIYSKAQQLYGTKEIPPVNTFNKVWILADKADVYEHGQTAFVVGGHLKVMLEEDYVSMVKHIDVGAGRRPALNPDKGQPNGLPLQRTNKLGSQIVREIVLPELEKEVNAGKNFAMLRQIFNSLILASWYKKNLKESLLNQVYADKSTIKGVNLSDPSIKEQIYQQYLEAYKKGVFNYIKEDSKSDGQSIPRKYFSGGFGNGLNRPGALNVADDLSSGFKAAIPTGSDFEVSVLADMNQSSLAMTTDAGDQRKKWLERVAKAKRIYDAFIKNQRLQELLPVVLVYQFPTDWAVSFLELIGHLFPKLNLVHMASIAKGPHGQERWREMEQIWKRLFSQNHVEWKAMNFADFNGYYLVMREAMTRGSQTSSKRSQFEIKSDEFIAAALVSPSTLRQSGGKSKLAKEGLRSIQYFNVFSDRFLRMQPLKSIRTLIDEYLIRLEEAGRTNGNPLLVFTTTDQFLMAAMIYYINPFNHDDVVRMREAVAAVENKPWIRKEIIQRIRDVERQLKGLNNSIENGNVKTMSDFLHTLDAETVLRRTLQFLRAYEKSIEDDSLRFLPLIRKEAVKTIVKLGHSHRFGQKLNQDTINELKRSRLAYVGTFNSSDHVFQESSEEGGVIYFNSNGKRILSPDFGKAGAQKILHFIRDEEESLYVVVFDAAMNVLIKKATLPGMGANTFPGGIDLTKADSGLTIQKDASGGVKVSFDQAMVARIQKDGVYSLEPMIINISRIGTQEMHELLSK